MITTILKALKNSARPKTRVSEEAVVKRLNRRLKRHHLRLRAARRNGGYENSNLGRHYIDHPRSNRLVFDHVNIEALARDFNVLGPSEFLV